MAYITNDRVMRADLPNVDPWELADNLDGIAPAGCPIMSTCFVVDKQDVAFCNGKDQWFASNGGTVKSINAGQSWSELFTD